jgi:hypothetical protein
MGEAKEAGDGECDKRASPTKLEEPFDPPAAADEATTNEPSDLQDTRDEEADEVDSYDDPYTYSDDSLSDAYFFPQSDDDLGRPSRYRDEDVHHYPVASYYGSLNGVDRATSPLWVGGAIQEDSELAMREEESALFVSAESGLNNGQWKDQKRKRRHQQRVQLKQRERVARERAVRQVRGRPQEVTDWQDSIFAIIFLAQLVAIFFCALRYGYVLFDSNSSGWFSSLATNHTGPVLAHHETALLNSSTALHELGYNTSDSHDHIFGSSLNRVHHSISGSTAAHSSAFIIDYKNIISLVCVAGFYACILTYLSFGCMLILARALIQIVLVVSVLLALAWGMIGLSLDPYGVISVMGFTSLLLTLGYSIASWSRIPFVATNLHIAVCAMRCTADITILGLTSILVAFGWCIIWTMAFVGLVNSLSSAECTKNFDCEPHFNSGYIPFYLVLLLSFHWTNTVIKNVVRVTVASAIGTWWFKPKEIGPFCTSAVLRPLLRSLTKSLGSICLGSLVVQPAWILSVITQCCSVIFWFGDKSCSTQPRVIHPLQDAEEPNDGTDYTGLYGKFCQFQDRVRYFLRSCNRWSFVYIGMCKLWTGIHTVLFQKNIPECVSRLFLCVATTHRRLWLCRSGRTRFTAVRDP